MLLVVVPAAIIIPLLLPHGEFIQTLASVPLFTALTAVAVEVLREQARRQHDTALAEAERRFHLSSTRGKLNA